MRRIALGSILLLLQACGGPIQSFTAGSSKVGEGVGTSLTAVFTSAWGEIDHGIGRVSSGVPVNTGPLRYTTTFTLTVEGGDSESLTVEVTPAYSGGGNFCMIAALSGHPVETALVVALAALFRPASRLLRRRPR